MKQEKPWSLQEFEILDRLWMEGHSSAEIGRMMGRTKNSILGKVHRRKLAKRPSPIKPRTGNIPPPKKARPMPGLQQRQIKLGIRGRRIKDPRKGCLWPMWDDKDKPNHKYCGRKRHGLAVYCAAHCARAYVKRAA